MPAVPGDQIETAFLQLVLRRIWAETINLNLHTLSLKTLNDMGGALKIVNTHVRNVMDALPETQREIAARLFGYLVTPSRSKIAQAVGDLVTFGEAPKADVMTVLSTLTDNPDSRILRRLSSPERYELFHDVLAQPILDWRRGFLEEKKRLSEQREQEAELARNRSEVRRLRAFALAMLVVSLLAILAALYGYSEKRIADSSAQDARHSELRAQVAEREAQAREKVAEAATARAKHQESVAQGLDAKAQSLERQATDLKTKADGASVSASSLQGRLDTATRDLQTEKDSRAAAETQVRTLQTKLGQANASIGALTGNLEAAQKSLQALAVPAPKETVPVQREALPGQAALSANTGLDSIRSQVTISARMSKPNKGVFGSKLAQGYVEVVLFVNASKTVLRLKRVAIEFTDGRKLPSIAPDAPGVASLDIKGTTLGSWISSKTRK